MDSMLQTLKLGKKQVMSHMKNLKTDFRASFNITVSYIGNWPLQDKRSTYPSGRVSDVWFGQISWRMD